MPVSAGDRFLDAAREIADPLWADPSEAMRAYSVRTVVNSPKNDAPKCIEPTP